LPSPIVTGKKKEPEYCWWLCSLKSEKRVWTFLEYLTCCLITTDVAVRLINSKTSGKKSLDKHQAARITRYVLLYPLQWMIPAIDYILISTRRRKSITTARKSMLKLVKLQSLAAKCCKMRKIIALQNLQILY
jgi:hypothetical protein